MAREHFTFSHALRVRWAEVDKQGIVFNGNYFTYFDVAITEYWRALGIDMVFADTLYTVKASAEYHGSAEYDDILDIHCRAARLGRSSIQFLLEIWRGEAHLVSGELIYVNADPASRRPVPIPELLRQKIWAYERVKPEAAPARA